MHKHVGALERAGLVTKIRHGREQRVGGDAATLRTAHRLLDDLDAGPGSASRNANANSIRFASTLRRRNGVAASSRTDMALAYSGPSRLGGVARLDFSARSSTM